MQDLGRKFGPRSPSQWPRERWPGSKVQPADWTAALPVSARPERGAGAVASSPQHAAMLIVAAGVSFSGSENARQELSCPTQSIWGTAATAVTAAAAADALGRVAGMIKKAVYR